MSTTSTICNFSGNRFATYFCATGTWPRLTRTRSDASTRKPATFKWWSDVLYSVQFPHACIALTSRMTLRSEPPRRDDPYLLRVYVDSGFAAFA